MVAPWVNGKTFTVGSEVLGRERVKLPASVGSGPYELSSPLSPMEGGPEIYDDDVTAKFNYTVDHRVMA